MDFDDDFEYHLKIPSGLVINNNSSDEDEYTLSPSDSFKQQTADLMEDGEDANKYKRSGEEGLDSRQRRPHTSSSHLLVNQRRASSPKEPVVILLGWLGCSNKNLSKYSDIYEANGCVTISYIASPWILFFKPTKCKENAKKLLNLLIDFNYEENPIFFHMFSNGGCTIYRYICELLCTNQFRHLNIQGCIYDSAPGKPRPYQAVKAILISMQNKNIFFKFLVAIILYLYLFVVTNLRAFLGIFQPRSSSIYEYLKMEQSSKCPQLFLFSTADDIIFSKDIKEFVRYRQEILGINVTTVEWTDSSHVKHLLKNRETYTDSCQSFLDKCLLDNR